MRALISTVKVYGFALFFNVSKMETENWSNMMQLDYRCKNDIEMCWVFSLHFPSIKPLFLKPFRNHLSDVIFYSTSSQCSQNTWHHQPAINEGKSSWKICALKASWSLLSAGSWPFACCLATLARAACTHIHSGIADLLSWGVRLMTTWHILRLHHTPPTQQESAESPRREQATAFWAA